MASVFNGRCAGPFFVGAAAVRWLKDKSFGYTHTFSYPMVFRKNRNLISRKLEKPQVQKISENTAGSYFGTLWCQKEGVVFFIKPVTFAVPKFQKFSARKRAKNCIFITAFE